MRKKQLLALAVGVVMLALPGCGDDGSSSGAGSAGTTTVTTAAPVEVRVSSIDNVFRPEQLRVEAGTKVTWTNDGRNDHNVVPDEGDAWGVDAADFKPGYEYSHTFTEPGTYGYHCSLHGAPGKAMFGVVTVTA